MAIEVFVQERDRVLLPSNLVDRLWGTEDASFVIRRVCQFCNSTGKDARLVHQVETTLAECACKHCAGRGFKEEYLSLDQIYQLLMPHMMQELVRQLPEIVERSKLEVIRAIMDS